MRTVSLYNGATIGLSADEFRAFAAWFTGALWRPGYEPESVEAMLDNPWRGVVDWCDFDRNGEPVGGWSFPLSEDAAACLTAAARAHGLACQDFRDGRAAA